jgi:hypothetical protein
MGRDILYAIYARTSAISLLFSVRTVKTTNENRLRKNGMKSLVLYLILILGTISIFQAHAFQDIKKPADINFEKIDAVEAMAIANEWKWSQKDVKSFVNAREVVFKFSDGKEQKIPLPEEKMIVAVAPYLRKTHK